MGREFALVHPSTAGLLAERGNDPDVERLLEGFAFLTARIRERVDDAVPGGGARAVQLLLPHYLRPVPASSIIQYQPSLRALRGRHVRAAAAPGSPPSRCRDTSCEFRTTASVDLLPLELADATLDETAAARPVIRLRFTTTEAGRASWSARVRASGCSCTARRSLTSTLYLWLRRHCRSVAVRCGTNTQPALPPGSIVPVGFGRGGGAAALADLRARGPPLPARVLHPAVEVPVRRRAGPRPRADHRGQLRDRAHVRSPAGICPHASARRTFACSARRSSTCSRSPADPIKRDARMSEHLLRASGLRPAHMEIFEVTEVVGVRQGQVQRKRYPPFIAYTHAADGREAAYYTLRHTASPLDDATDTYLSIVTPRDVAPVRVDEVLSIDIVATNRNLPAELQLGEISTTPRGVSRPRRSATSLRVTIPTRAPVGWSCTGGCSRTWPSPHVARRRRGAARDAGALQLPEGTERDGGTANELKIESHASVTVRAGHATARGRAGSRRAHARRGRGVAARHRPARRSCSAACSTSCSPGPRPLNSFAELHLVLHPSKVEFQWPARTVNGRIL